MMLAVARDPFLRHDRRRKPEPEPHWKRGEIMQLDAAVCLCAVKEQRHADIGEMTGDHDEENRLPPVRRPASKIRHYIDSVVCTYSMVSLGNLPGSAAPANSIAPLEYARAPCGMVPLSLASRSDDRPRSENREDSVTLVRKDDTRKGDCRCNRPLRSAVCGLVYVRLLPRH